LAEVLALWALYGAEAIAVFVTHARLSAAGEPEAGRFDPIRGARQVAIFFRHPLLPSVAAFVPIALSRLPPRQVIPTLGLGAAAGGIGGFALWRGAARWRVPIERADALAAAGVAAAFAVTVRSARVAGIGPVDRWTEGDAARLAVAAGLVAVGLPWIMADLGVYVEDVPVVGAPFLSRERRPPESSEAAVHLGHHHGIDGVLLALTALTLSRTLARLRPAPVREGLSLYLAGLFVYGVARAAEDAWNEQVVKRGWTSLKLPLVVEQGRPVRPKYWGGMLAVATLLHRRWFRRAGS
jgi:hypothetical protein